MGGYPPKRGGKVVEIGQIVLFGGLAVVCFSGGLIGGFLAQLVKSTLDGYKLAQLDRRTERLENTLKSGAGVQARNDKAERMGEAVAEAALLLKEGKKPEEIAKLLLPKYPDIALDLVKKAAQGKLGI